MTTRLCLAYVALLFVLQGGLAQTADEPDLRRALVEESPAKIAALIASPNPRQCRMGLASLGLHIPEYDPCFVSHAQLFLQNLDEDDELEAVLRIRQGEMEAVIVLDIQDGSWWRIGHFIRVFRFDTDADMTLELKSIISDRCYDLLIRDSGGGTDISETHLSMYRLRQGRLQRVFRISESARYRVVGGSSRVNVILERAWLTYPSREISGIPLIVADRTRVPIGRTTEFNPERELRFATSECTVYRWDEQGQVFTPDSGEFRRYCPKRR